MSTLKWQSSSRLDAVRCELIADLLLYPSELKKTVAGKRIEVAANLLVENADAVKAVAITGLPLDVLTELKQKLH